MTDCPHCGGDHSGLTFDCVGEYIPMPGETFGRVEISTTQFNHIHALAAGLPVLEPTGDSRTITAQASSLWNRIAGAGTQAAPSAHTPLNLGELLLKRIEELLFRAFPNVRKGHPIADSDTIIPIDTALRDVAVAFGDVIKLPDWLMRTYGR